MRARSRDAILRAQRASIDLIGELLEARELEHDETLRADLMDLAAIAQAVAHRVKRLEGRAGIDLPVRRDAA